MRYIVWFLVIIVLGIGIWFVAVHRRVVPTPTPDTAAQDEAAQGKTQQTIRAQVAAFGDALKNVSLLSPTASADIEHAYSPYVSKSLRAAWESHPTTALGRTVSSPWPDHIDIVSIDAAENNTWTVRAMLVYMTSNEVEHGGDAGTETLQLIMVNEDGSWKVDSTTVLQQNKPNAPRSMQDRPQLE